MNYSFHDRFGSFAEHSSTLSWDQAQHQAQYQHNSALGLSGALQHVDARSKEGQASGYGLGALLAQEMNRVSCWGCHLQEKNVSSDALGGKVGRIYMPRQDLGALALHKMKVRCGSTANNVALF